MIEGIINFLKSEEGGLDHLKDTITQLQQVMKWGREGLCWGTLDVYCVHSSGKCK